MKPIAILRFVHDLEDGWYQLYKPDGEFDGDWFSPWNARRYCMHNGWDIRYIGDSQYDPFK